MEFHYFIDAIKKYAVFDGRANRTEYWMFRLYHAIIFFFIVVLAQQIQSTFLVIIFTVFILGTLLPGWAIDVRRLHDAGKSGWWVLVPIVAIIFLFQPSDTNPNHFG